MLASYSTLTLPCPLLQLQCVPQLLGLNWRETYLDPQLMYAYEELSAAPVEDGFTTQVSFALLRFDLP